jgi:PAS domain S-box-containing protein
MVKIMSRKKAIDINDKNKTVEILREGREQNKRAEYPLRNTEEHYRMLFDGMEEGFCVIEVLFDDNEKPVDYLFLEVNPAFEKQTGLVNAPGKRMREFAPKHEEYWFEIFGKVAITGEPAKFQNQAEQLNRWYKVNAFRIGKPEDRQVAIIFNDISDQIRMEANATARATEMETILSCIGEGVQVYDKEAKIIFANSAADNIYEYKKNDPGLSIEDKVIRADDGAWAEDGHRLAIDEYPEFRSAIYGETIKNMIIKFYRQGKPHWINISSVPLIVAGKHVGGVNSIADITERKKAEDALRKNEERFRTLADNILQLTWMTDESGYIFWYNKRWYDYTGTTFEEMQGWGWEKVHHPDHIDRVMKIWTDALKEGKPWEDIFPLRSKEGEYGWFLSRAMPIRDDNGKILRWFGTNTDITERMKAEEALKEAYKNIEERFKEKEVLLRELYHRTKNNMQVISSLLGLKGERGVENETKEMLRDVRNRIQAIALVHEKLYQSKNLSRIDLKEYITDLANLLLESYNSTGRKIKLKLDLESISVLIDTAIPCGQIIAELISNSLKHAFPVRDDGEIFIHLSGNKNNLIKLIISDNGIGISGYSEDIGKNTLGMQLFRNLVEDQLKGDISFNMQNGVSWTITFKDVLYDERV